MDIYVLMVLEFRPVVKVTNDTSTLLITETRVSGGSDGDGSEDPILPPRRVDTRRTSPESNASDTPYSLPCTRSM